MNINLRTEIDEEIDFFIDKFVEQGWYREDEAYITKNVGFVVHPNSKSEEWKTSIGIAFFPKILHYTVRDRVNRTIDPTSSVWIQGRVLFDYDSELKDQRDSKILKQVAEYLKEEFQKIEFKPFFDEDAFKNNFSRPKKTSNEFVEMSFFLNKDYPNGYWQNHTIEV